MCSTTCLQQKSSYPLCHFPSPQTVSQWPGHGLSWFISKPQGSCPHLPSIGITEHITTPGFCRLSYRLSSCPSLLIFFLSFWDRTPHHTVVAGLNLRDLPASASRVGTEGTHHYARLIFHCNLWSYFCLFISSQDILMYPWLSWNSWHKLGQLCSQQRCAGPCFLSAGTKGTYHHAWLVKSSWVWTL